MNPGALFRQILPWLVALALIVIAGAVAIWLLRRGLGRTGGGGAAGFSLQELRGLRAEGKLTPEEFERAKASIIGRVQGEERPNTSPAPARACKSPGMVEPLDSGDESPID
jgi:hypothetical protein